MAPKLFHNSNIPLIVVLLPVIFFSPIKTSSVSVTETYSLIRVPIFRRVSSNIIPHSSLQFFIIAEYKPGELVVPNGTTRDAYFWLFGAKKALG